METTRLSIKKLSNLGDLNLPSYATSGSAGIDLLAAIEDDIVIQPGKRFLIKTGIAIALKAGYEAQIRPRSGLAYKNGITVLNTPGTIDADYRGEIGVILVNLGEEDFTVSRGMRIAQMVISAYSKADLQVVDDLDETDRGSDGFGSTGVNEEVGVA